jgi:hypothetical protein
MIGFSHKISAVALRIKRHTDLSREEPLDTVQLDTVQLDTVQLDTVQLDTVQLDTVQLDTVQFDTVQLDPLELQFQPRRCGASGF